MHVAEDSTQDQVWPLIQWEQGSCLFNIRDRGSIVGQSALILATIHKKKRTSLWREVIPGN